MTAPNIQAIDRARAREPDVDRFRGAVLLRAGIYDIARSFRISAGVVVLRAHGDHPDSTVIRAVGKTRRVLLTLSGVVDHTEISHTRQRITDSTCPVGVSGLGVLDASGVAVGDDVRITRTLTQAWIDDVGMDACTSEGTVYDSTT
jgi:hypothetical protein